MRVAWQAGVIKALEEAEVNDFTHADGTSGGIFNLSALLSGVTPTDLVERWCTLDPKRFVSFAPLKEYLDSPTNLRAMGDADGLVHDVLPHLGISIDRINTHTAMSGSFNVANFTTKTAVAIPHTEIDLPRLVAGVSLPIFLPAVEAHGATWTDAVWMRDANPLEAVRRGANELWLLWCIGNTSRWGNGALEQYVHMIELSANSALFEDLAGIETAFRLHVIKPRFPLPLDPDYYMGRIASDALVAMGYRDAWNYLASRHDAGVTPDHTCTQMIDPPLGVRMRTEYAVDLGGIGNAQLVVNTEVHDLERFCSDRGDRADICGFLLHPDGTRWLLRDGTFLMETVGEHRTRLTTRATCGPTSRPLALELVGEWHDDEGFDFWSDLTTAKLTLRSADGAVVDGGQARLGVNALRHVIASIEPTGAHDLGDRASIIARAARFFFGRFADR